MKAPDELKEFMEHIVKACRELEISILSTEVTVKKDREDKVVRIAVTWEMDYYHSLTRDFWLSVVSEEFEEERLKIMATIKHVAGWKKEVSFKNTHWEDMSKEIETYLRGLMAQKAHRAELMRKAEEEGRYFHE